MKNEVKIIHTACSNDCGGGCIFKAHVKDGKIQPSVAFKPKR